MIKITRLKTKKTFNKLLEKYLISALSVISSKYLYNLGFYLFCLIIKSIIKGNARLNISDTQAQNKEKLL